MRIMQESIPGDQPWLRNGRHAEGMVAVKIDLRADYHVSSVCTRVKVQHDGSKQLEAQEPESTARHRSAWQNYGRVDEPFPLLSGR
jgi:hypothetical protein